MSCCRHVDEWVWDEASVADAAAVLGVLSGVSELGAHSTNAVYYFAL